jgi:hypothetical protein
LPAASIKPSANGSALRSEKRAPVTLSFPTAGIEQMLDEIEQGYSR